MPAEETSTEFYRPVVAERVIAASAEKAWEVISAPGNLEECHPFCASNPVQEWPGPDSRDEIHYLSGLTYERRFLGWHEGVGYDLEIARSGRTVARVSWRITPIDENSCSLNITVHSKVLNTWPVFARWVPNVLRIRPMLKNYLDSVTRGFEWYITRGEAVPRDQFGPHPWFSAT